jgi:flagellar assembly protein FliH
MSTVIKSGGPIRASDGVSFNFDDMADKANQYLDQVRQQALQIVQKAEQDAAAVRARAEEEGRQAAMRAVERVMDEKVGKQMATLLPALKQTIDTIQQAKQSWLQHWEKTALHVSAAIAAKIIRREVSRAPEITLTLVKEALELAAGSPEIQLRLNPGDHAALAGQVERLTGELGRLGATKIVADPQITPGGCRVDTRFGVIDQQFEAQLARIEEELG